MPNIPTNTQFVNENFKAATSMYQRYTYCRYYIEYYIWSQLMIYGIFCLITIRYIFRNIHYVHYSTHSKAPIDSMSNLILLDRLSVLQMYRYLWFMSKKKVKY